MFIALLPQASLSFINNTAQVGSALYLQYMEQCSFAGFDREESSTPLASMFRSDNFFYRYQSTANQFILNMLLQLVNRVTVWKSTCSIYNGRLKGLSLKNDIVYLKHRLYATYTFLLAVAIRTLDTHLMQEETLPTTSLPLWQGLKCSTPQ